MDNNHPKRSVPIGSVVDKVIEATEDAAGQALFEKIRDTIVSEDVNIPTVLMPAMPAVCRAAILLELSREEFLEVVGPTFGDQLALFWSLCIYEAQSHQV